MTPIPARGSVAAPPVAYPESDDEPMAENTEQFDWIVTLKENLDLLLPHAFVAGDLFWYPVEGNNRVRLAPDVMVAFGRPKGRRGSYMQWVEGGQPPDVVIEIWTPKNNFRHQVEKLAFYDRYGVREFITWDHDRHHFVVYERQEGELRPINAEGGWVSPSLGVRFVQTGEQLEVFGPDGRVFQKMGEIARARDVATMERDAANARAEALAAKLRSLGIDPDAG